MSPYKSLQTILRYPESRIVYSSENSYAELDIIDSPSIKSAPGLSLKYQKVPPPQKGIAIDGDNLSAITEVGGTIADLNFLDFMPASVLYTLKPGPEKVLVVEPKGGMDILSALYFKSGEVQVLENDSLVIDAMSGDFSGYSGDIYNHRDVTVFETSSRNYAKITGEKFDLIVLSLSDSFHPISAGAYSLNENYLYTVESFKDLTRILKEDGVLAVTRWVQFPPSENLKILSTLCSSLSGEYIEDVPEKIFAFRSWSTLTTMFKPDGFSAAEIGNLMGKLTELNYDIVYYKDMEVDEANRFSRLEEPYFYDYFKYIIEADRNSVKGFYND